MNLSENLYLTRTELNLYRLGNAASAKLDHLRLINDHGEHYLPTPEVQMPLDEFKTALSRMAENAERDQKLAPSKK
jgi:hypothetical protein